MSFLRDKPGDLLPGLQPYLDMLDHNFFDAAVAAYTALLRHRNKVDTLGSSEEGVIVIPI